MELNVKYGHMQFSAAATILFHVILRTFCFDKVIILFVRYVVDGGITIYAPLLIFIIIKNLHKPMLNLKKQGCRELFDKKEMKEKRLRQLSLTLCNRTI